MERLNLMNLQIILKFRIVMNEHIDLTKILDGCPEGTKFYSSEYGDVVFVGLDLDNKHYQVELKYHRKDNPNSTVDVWVTKGGKTWSSYDGECSLFPSKDQRDWSKFERFWDEPKVERIDVNTFQPFDKILARNSDRENWTIEYYSYGKEVSFGNGDKYIQGLVYCWKYVIPYNDETKHLLGTREDCPEYYKWWKVEQGFWGEE